VIYLKDHLNSEDNLTMSIESNQTEGNLDNDCEIISFPSDEVEEVSKEEIGKWVDQLMDMPEPENSFSDILDNFSIEHEDPFIRVAERILSEETS
jgi:hypothetical protein